MIGDFLWIHLKEISRQLHILLSRRNNLMIWNMFWNNENIKIRYINYARSANRFDDASICEWDIRARDQHYVKKVWPSRNSLEIGSKNISKKYLLPVEKILLPSLHIKLCLIKQFVKTMKMHLYTFFRNLQN